MKKIATLLTTVLLVSALLLSIAACGGGGGNDNTSGGGTAASSDGAASSSSGSSGSTASGDTTASGGSEADGAANRSTVFEPATYTVYMGDSLSKTNTQWSDTEVGKLIEEITGIHLDIEYIVGSDELERAALLVATGDYPDIIIPHNVGQTFIDAGAVIPLNDLYDQYCVNIQQLWGNAIERVKDLETGILWGLSSETYSSPPMDYPFAAFFMKNAAVAFNGYKTITDPDEYFNVIREYVAANPTTNGQPTIGFSGPTETWRYVFTLLMGERLYGYPNTGRRIYDPADNFKVHDRNMMSYRYNYLWTLNQLNQEGLLDPEMFSQTHDEYVAKIAAGRVVGFGDEYWQVTDAFSLIKQDGRIDDVYIPFAPMYDDRAQGMNDPYAGIKGMAVRTNMNISVNAKDPAGILQYIDYLASPDMLELMYWGIEGTHYQKDENGRNYLTAAQYDERSLDVEYGNKTGVGHIFGSGLVPKPLEPYEERPDGKGVWDPMLDMVRVQYIYDDMEKEVLSRLGWNAFTDSTGDMWLSPYGYGWEITIPTDDDRLNEINALLESELGGENCPAWTQGMVLASSKSEFDALWDDLQAKLTEVGIQEMNDFFTARARQRVEEFNRGN